MPRPCKPVSRKKPGNGKTESLKKDLVEMAQDALGIATVLRKIDEEREFGTH